MSRAGSWASPMLRGAELEADVVLVAPREFEVTRAQRTYREKNVTTFTELLSVNSLQADYIKRINEALGLEALATYLRSAGLRVAILNCNVAPHTSAEIREKVIASGARVVGISLIYRPQVGLALDLLEALRGLPVHISMGGALASFMPRELLGCLPALDSVAFGEAEETFRDLCSAIVGGGDWRHLPGIAFREGGVAVINAAAPALDLAKIHTPARDTLEYLRAAGWPTRIASIYTSRGCMAKCTFCTGKDAYNVERLRTYRFRAAIDVVDEIQALHDEFGVRFVYINDDNFLGYGKRSFDRVRAIAEDLIERDLGVQFATECRVDGLDRELLQLLKEAGMRQVLLGIESGSDRVLQRWRKGATTEQNREAIALVKSVGLALEPGFILYDAHTSAEELQANVDFFRQTGLHYITPVPTYLVNRLSVYPGTEIERLLINDGTLEPSPFRYGEAVQDDPGAIVDYFQRLEYVCRDPRSEIAWRSLRLALEPVEMFMEDQLPPLLAILSECRGHEVPDDLRPEVRRLIRQAARWRRRVSELVITLLEECIASYGSASHAEQLRHLRRRLVEVRLAYERETLGGTIEEFTEWVLAIRQRILPRNVTVIIPTVGKWSRLRRALGCLARQQVDPGTRWEILVVLDGVESPSDLEQAADGVPCRTLALPERRGRGAARNAGVADCRAEHVIFLDDDVLVGSDFVASHLAHQRQRASLCHGPLREVPGLVYIDDLDSLRLVPELAERPSAQRMRSWARDALARLEDPAACWDRLGSPSRLEQDGLEALARGRRGIGWVAFAGANLSGPRRWFVEDGFDERAGTNWGLEDIGLALRWALAGRPLSVAEGARGLHLSHHRGAWREQLRASLPSLDFVPRAASRAILEYLEGTGSAAAMEEEILPLLAPRRQLPAPSALPSSTADGAVPA